MFKIKDPKTKCTLARKNKKIPHQQQKHRRIKPRVTSIVTVLLNFIITADALNVKMRF